MRTTWPGFYFSGRTAAREAVTVTITPTALRLDREGGPSAWWPHAEVRLTQGAFAGEQVRLERGPEPAEAVVIEDRAFLDAVRAIAPSGPVAASSGRGWGRWRRLVGLAVAALALLAGGYFSVLPVVADAVARRVPVSWEEQLGDDVAAPLAAAAGVCDDSAVVGAVTAIVTRLSTALPEQRYRFRVQVLEGPQVNAFAVPGGRIAVYHGLLSRTGRAEELAGVLAHEMQHVIRRHGTRAILREIPIRVFVGLMAGDLVGVREAAGALGTLGVLRYGRRDELEADREGLALVTAAGIDPAGMVAFFDTLAAVGADVPRGVAYLSSHPATAERRARLTARAAGAPAATRTALDLGDWSAVKNRCGADPGPRGM